MFSLSFKNSCLFTFSPVMHSLLFVRSKPSELKVRSDSTLVAGTQRYFLTIFESRGYLSLLFFHHSSGSHSLSSIGSFLYSWISVLTAYLPGRMRLPRSPRRRCWWAARTRQSWPRFRRRRHLALGIWQRQKEVSHYIILLWSNNAVRLLLFYPQMATLVWLN